MKYIQYFDSIEELRSKIENTNFEEISRKMGEWNREREERVNNRWKSIVDEYLYL